MPTSTTERPPNAAATRRASTGCPEIMTLRALSILNPRNGPLQEMSGECDAAPAAVPDHHLASGLTVLRAASVLATMSVARQDRVAFVTGSRGPARVQIMRPGRAAPRNA